MTQKEFADSIGVKPLTVLRYEQNPEKIPESSIKLIEYEFGLRQPPAIYQTNSTPGALIRKEPAGALRSNSLGKGIPLVRPESLHGPDNFNLSQIMENALDFYQISDLKDADFMIRVRGDGMSKTYNAGDIVACKRIKTKENLAWNRIYVISTKSWGTMVKRIKQGEDGFYTLLSDNENYEPMQMPSDEITDLALVVGGVRLEG